MTSSRLTPLEQRDRAMSEIELQRLLVGKDGLAPMLGWEHVHWRPAETKHGWRTPASGTMAAGWPDLVLVRVRDRRLIFAELKKEVGELSPDQWRVMALLGAIAGTTRVGDTGPMLSVESYVWRPSDLRDPLEESAIYRVLR